MVALTVRLVLAGFLNALAIPIVPIVGPTAGRLGQRAAGWLFRTPGVTLGYALTALFCVGSMTLMLRSGRRLVTRLLAVTAVVVVFALVDVLRAPYDVAWSVSGLIAVLTPARWWWRSGPSSPGASRPSWLAASPES